MSFRTIVCGFFVAVFVLTGSAAEDPTLTKAREAIKARAEKIENLLKDGRVAHTFEDRSFQKAIAFVKEKFSLEIVIDPVVNAEDRKVPVEVLRNISLDSALKLLCGADLHHSVRGEAVFITTSEAAMKMRGTEFVEPEKPAEAQKKLILALHQVRTGIGLENKPVKEALAVLEGKGSVKIKSDPPKAADGMMVTISVKDASLRSLLDLVCGSRLAWMLADDSILVGPSDAMRKKQEEIKVKEEAQKKAEEEAKKKAEEKAKKETEKKSTQEQKKMTEKEAEKPAEKEVKKESKKDTQQGGQK